MHALHALIKIHEKVNNRGIRCRRTRQEVGTAGAYLVNRQAGNTAIHALASEANVLPQTIAASTSIDESPPLMVLLRLA